MSSQAMSIALTPVRRAAWPATPPGARVAAVGVMCSTLGGTTSTLLTGPRIRGQPINQLLKRADVLVLVRDEGEHRLHFVIKRFFHRRIRRMGFGPRLRNLKKQKTNIIPEC